MSFLGEGEKERETITRTEEEKNLKRNAF